MKKSVRQITWEYAQILVGCAITAAALDTLLVPNKIAAGGVSGIGTILINTQWKIPVGVTMLVLNIPLFFFSVKRLGKAFGVRTLFGAIAISAFTDLLAPYLPHLAKTDPMLAALYGGAIAGIGMGLVFRGGGTTAGTDLAASLMHSYTAIPVGKALFFVDFFVIVAAGAVFHNADLAMYALFAMFLNSYVIDLVIEGMGSSRAAIIICTEPKAIAQRILTEMGRGCTGLVGEGMYTGQEREILLCVVSRTEIMQLKEIIHENDPKAFVIMASVHEVLGEGFKRLVV